jgi:hypothetical protein
MIKTKNMILNKYEYIAIHIGLSFATYIENWNYCVSWKKISLREHKQLHHGFRTVLNVDNG